MKNAKRALIAAVAVSLFCVVGQSFIIVRLEQNVRSYRLLGLLTDKLAVLAQQEVDRHLIEGGWHVLVACLIMFSVYSLRKLN